MSPEALLDLARPRTIAIVDRGQTFTLECRRVTQDDWSRYFAGIAITSEQNGKERINVVDVTTPRLALAESVLIAARGYKVAGDQELSSIPDWPKRIPIAHRLKLGEILADARPSRSDEFVIYPEGDVVSLDATWSAVMNGETPVMQRFEGLRHILRAPSEEQFRRYQRESSKSIVQGGSRSGKTIYKGAQTVLAKLYDELIARVEGYSVNGEPLNDVPTITREMDTLHKVVAAQELFQPQDTSALAQAEAE